MATAGTLDITIEQGSRFRQVITWHTSAGAAVNLTGYTARMQIRKTRTSATTIASWTSAAGNITLGGAAGTVTIDIDDSVTAALDFATGRYDLELEDGSGNVTRLLEGKVTLSKEVTR